MYGRVSSEAIQLLDSGEIAVSELKWEGEQIDQQLSRTRYRCLRVAYLYFTGAELVRVPGKNMLHVNGRFRSFQE
jgi:hypothetical protein